MMRYFVSRINNKSKIKALNDNIGFIKETLLQLHCYKTFKSFLKIAQKNEEKKYFSIYLMFVWVLYSFVCNKNENKITKMFSFLINRLLFEFEAIFKIFADEIMYKKCNQMHRYLYPEYFDNESEDGEDDENEVWTMNCKKIDHCPICKKMTMVTMNNGMCGSDGDQNRHLVSRCLISFEIIASYKQFYCRGCDGSFNAEIIKKLMHQTVDCQNIMIQSFGHCKPFTCCICGTALVQLL